MSVEKRLEALGIVLPPVPKPVGAYVPFVRTGPLLFLSGMIPLADGRLIHQGKVGRDLDLDRARQAARTALLNGLAVLQDALGTLDGVDRIVRLTGFVASTPDFTQQPLVLNEASELLVQLFGDKGRHARSAVGVPVLPLDAPVELELTVACR